MFIKKFKLWTACLAGVALLLGSGFTVHAEPIDYYAEMEARKLLPVQTNEIPGWPEGPAVGAQSAILMDAQTGAILYAKDIDARQYPASVTKIMTCLLAVENSEPDEMVTFSHEAVFSIERGSSNIGMDEGESITMNQALHGILILSANEVANAVGEHIAGDAQSFVDMMNAKAEELGCENTHFMNAHGLHDENHYTSARDLALIAREFFSHDMLANISGMTYCTFEATETQPDSFTLSTKNMLVEGKEYEYEWLVGSKTGYTNQARQTLVSCAKKDGMELICVVMVEESPHQFTDTVALFDYGFQNFKKVNVSENETNYTMANTGFLESGSDIFGNSSPFISLDKDSYVILPTTADFDDLTSELVYDTNHTDSVAEVQYFYEDNYVGETYVKVSGQTTALFQNDTSSEETNKPVTNEDEDSIFINVKVIVIIVACVVVLVIGILFWRTIMQNYHFAKRRMARKRRKRRRTGYDSSEFKNLKF